MVGHPALTINSLPASNPTPSIFKKVSPGKVTTGKPKA